MLFTYLCIHPSQLILHAEKYTKSVLDCSRVSQFEFAYENVSFRLCKHALACKYFCVCMCVILKDAQIHSET